MFSNSDATFSQTMTDQKANEGSKGTHQDPLPNVDRIGAAIIAGFLVIFCSLIAGLTFNIHFFFVVCLFVSHVPASVSPAFFIFYFSLITFIFLLAQA
jgi:hypothetical protein